MYTYKLDVLEVSEWRRNRWYVQGFVGVVLETLPDGTQHEAYRGPIRKTDRQAYADADAALDRIVQQRTLEDIDAIAKTLGFDPIGDWLVEEMAHPTLWAWLDDSQEPDGIDEPF